MCTGSCGWEVAEKILQGHKLQGIISKKMTDVLDYRKMLVYLRTTKQYRMSQNNLHINVMYEIRHVTLYTSATGMTPRGWTVI